MAETPPANATQLPLGLRDPDSSGPMQARGIFSVSYLRRHLALGKHLPAPSEVKDLHEKARDLWHKNYAGLIKRNEQYTRSTTLNPLLNDLGWRFIPEQKLPARGPIAEGGQGMIHTDR